MLNRDKHIQVAIGYCCAYTDRGWVILIDETLTTERLVIFIESCTQTETHTMQRRIETNVNDTQPIYILQPDDYEQWYIQVPEQAFSF